MACLCLNIFFLLVACSFSCLFSKLFSFIFFSSSFFFICLFFHSFI
jgi:hypothetical protein